MWSSHLFRTFCRKVYRPNCQCCQGVQRFEKVYQGKPLWVSRTLRATSCATPRIFLFNFFVRGDGKVGCAKASLRSRAPTTVATNCATPRYSLFRYAPQNVLDRKRIYYSKCGADCQIFLLPSGKYLENYFKRGERKVRAAAEILPQRLLRYKITYSLAYFLRLKGASSRTCLPLLPSRTSPRGSRLPQRPAWISRCAKW